MNIITKDGIEYMEITITETGKQPMKELQPLTREMKLYLACEDIPTFKHEGRLYLGRAWDAVQAFIKNNPAPADFSVWLQNNYKEVV